MTAAQRLVRSTPEAEGVGGAAVLALIQALDAVDSVHSVMVLRHGRVIAEGWWHPYRAADPHSMYSVSKSFTATAVGLAIAEGRFALDDLVVDLLPDDAPATIDDKLAALRVRDLLTMTSGHAIDTVDAVERTATSWSRAVLSIPLEFEPGTRFVYNTPLSYLLSAIVQRATGERLLDYLRPRLLDPLGITGATWQQSPEGIDVGGFGMNITTEDMAVFGQLYLDHGKWKGEQLVPASWVTDSTSFQVPNAGPDTSPDDSEGYGFQFWRGRHDTYRADGAFGQWVVVIPEHDAVIAITSGAHNADVLDRIWEILLPAFGEPVFADPIADERLATVERELALPTVAGSDPETLIAGLAHRRFRLDTPIEGISAIELAADGRSVTVTQNDVENHLIPLGFGEWSRGVATLWGPDPVPFAGSWAADGDSLVALLHLTETPFAVTITAGFGVDHVDLEARLNVSFQGPNTTVLQITGRGFD